MTYTQDEQRIATNHSTLDITRMRNTSKVASLDASVSEYSRKLHAQCVDTFSNACDLRIANSARDETQYRADYAELAREIDELESRANALRVLQVRLKRAYYKAIADDLRETETSAS